MLFKIWKVERENLQLARDNKLLTNTLKNQQIIIDKLLSEISRRDQKIIEQQKRMRFFGIQIGNEEYEPEKLDFPSTIKL